MQAGEDVTFKWLKKKGLVNLPYPSSPVVPGERDSDTFSRRHMQSSSPEVVDKAWNRDLGSFDLLALLPSTIAEMIVVAMVISMVFLNNVSLR